MRSGTNGHGELLQEEVCNPAGIVNDGPDLDGENENYVTEYLLAG